MKVICIVDPEEDLKEAATKIAALGLAGFATNDAGDVKHIISVLKDNGFVIVTEEPALLKDIREEIQFHQMPVGNLGALASGRLATR